ncbi:MAG: cell division protein FtsQ [Elusimicrobia bacterium]|nr:cell division protein FtsQ [Elusimicrobiota bacterium]
MSKGKPHHVRIRRFRVNTRPKVRSRRRAEWGAALLVVGLVLLSVFVVRSIPRGKLHWPALTLPIPGVLRVEQVRIEGAPPELEKRLLDSVAHIRPEEWGLFGPKAARERLRTSFPCLREISAQRNWFSKRLTFTVAIHKAVARLAGRSNAWLSETGEAFDAPPGLFDEARTWPTVEVGASPSEVRRALGPVLYVMSKDGALPARLARMSWKGDDGWVARLEDGLELEWGDLQWTDQKLARLREVLSDASKKLGAGFSVDLRYFEEGKILVRPGPAKARPSAPAPAVKVGH